MDLILLLFIIFTILMIIISPISINYLFKKITRFFDSFIKQQINTNINKILDLTNANVSEEEKKNQIEKTIANIIIAKMAQKNILTYAGNYLIYLASGIFISSTASLLILLGIVNELLTSIFILIIFIVLSLAFFLAIRITYIASKFPSSVENKKELTPIIIDVATYKTRILLCESILSFTPYGFLGLFSAAILIMLNNYNLIYLYLIISLFLLNLILVYYAYKKHIQYFRKTEEFGNAEKNNDFN